MSERQKIIEKIRKLLRMQRGGTVDEITTALKLAQELAAKHGIDLNDVNPDDDGPKAEQPLGHKDMLDAKCRLQCEVKYSGLVCQKFFNVEVFQRYTGYKTSWTGWTRNIS